MSFSLSPLPSPATTESPVTTESPTTAASPRSNITTSPAYFENHFFVPTTEQAQHDQIAVSIGTAIDDSSNSTILPLSKRDKAIAPIDQISARIAAEEPQKIEGSLDDFLTEKEFHLDRTNLIGSGQFGNVYPVQIEGNDFVFKEEFSLTSLTHRELNGKLWRCGDIAASRLKDLPHFAKAEFFILRIKDRYGYCNETWYVPTSKIKAFGQSLKETRPDVTATILGSLMARASGKELLTYLQEGTLDPLTDFDPISHQLFEFLEVTHTRNFIHRDIKLENMIYNSSTKTLTVIDSSLGGVYLRRGKESSASNNSKISTRRTGTTSYLHPKVRKGEPHDSTIDFYSAGIALLLTLVKRTQDYEAILEFSDSWKSENLTPTEIFETLQSILKDKGSPIIETLENNSKIQKTLELFFAVAAGTEGTFEELQAQMQ